MEEHRKLSIGRYLHFHANIGKVAMLLLVISENSRCRASDPSHSIGNITTSSLTTVARTTVVKRPNSGLGVGLSSDQVSKTL